MLLRACSEGQQPGIMGACRECRVSGTTSDLRLTGLWRPACMLKPGGLCGPELLTGAVRELLLTAPNKWLSQHANPCCCLCWGTCLKMLPAELKVMDEKGDLHSGPSSLSCQGRDLQFLDVAPGCRPHFG